MSDQVCKVQYFPGAVINYYDGSGKYLGKDDHIEQRCVQKPVPAPRPEQSRGAEPKSSPSLWKTALAYLLSSGKIKGNKSIFNCGNVSEQCQGGIQPHYPEFIDPKPAKIDESLLSKGIQIIWEPSDPYLALSNCDYSTQGIYASCNFGSDNGGRLNFYPDQSGNFRITHTLHKKLTSPVLCDVFYTNPRTGGTLPKNLPSDYRFTLYKPGAKDTTKTQCEYANYAPSISTIDITSPSISNGIYPIGSVITVNVSTADCDGLDNGAQLIASLQTAAANTHLEMTKVGDVGGYRIFSKTFTVKEQTKSFCATVFDTDEDRQTSTRKCIDVTIVPASSSSSPIPSAVIGSNLKYAYHEGDIASNITAYSDDANASFKWTITRPDGNPADTFTTQTIPSYTFSSIGSYYFKLEVTASDGKTTNSTSRSVNVYSKTTDIPSAVIGSNLKYSYHAGETASNITAYSDDANASFKWTITRPDGNPADTFTTQTIPSYTFSSIGSYYFKLEVIAADGKTTNTDSRTVNVYPISTTIPSLSIQAPFSATVGTSVNFTVPNPDTTNYDYSFDFNDGTPSVSGTSAGHTFTSVGNYGVVVSARLKSDPSTIFQAKHNITIVPYATPNVGISGPTSAAVNTSVSFSVPNPTVGATYTWNFGDNGTATGTSASHTYTQTGNFQVKLSASHNGSTNSITHNITIY